MREIKFRVWNKDLKQMMSTDSTDTFQCFDKEHQEIYPIMQFTGLLDKNGKEIFEGDIILYDTVPVSGKHTATVEFRDGCFVCACHSWRLPPQPFMVEIIGNIHEHSHLLTNQEE